MTAEVWFWSNLLSRFRLFDALQFRTVVQWGISWRWGRQVKQCLEGSCCQTPLRVGLRRRKKIGFLGTSFFYELPYVRLVVIALSKRQEPLNGFAAGCKDETSDVTSGQGLAWTETPSRLSSPRRMSSKASHVVNSFGWLLTLSGTKRISSQDRLTTDGWGGKRWENLFQTLGTKMCYCRLLKSLHQSSPICCIWLNICWHGYPGCVAGYEVDYVPEDRLRVCGELEEWCI